MGFGSAEVFAIQPRLDGVDYLVGGLPGRGVKVNKACRREAPHLRRRDGSVTNW